MSIPFPTTTVTLLKSDVTPGGEDDWGSGQDVSTFKPHVTGIRAHLSAPGANAAFQSSGSTVAYEFRLLLDPCDLSEDMQVLDEDTGDQYQVNWRVHRPEPMAHVVAGVSRSIGSP